MARQNLAMRECFFYLDVCYKVWSEWLEKPCKITTIQTCEQAVPVAMQEVEEFSTENGKIVYNPKSLQNNWETNVRKERRQLKFLNN